MAANESTRERIEKMSIILDHVNYVYGADTPLAVHALNDVCLKIPDGQFIGIIGHTGSGKSTLMQHMNGLIRATDGHIYFNGEDIYDKDYDMKKLRSKVGLVFQYPEHQLFEIDVFSDVCFGPKNLGLDKKEVELRAYDALKKVGLPDELFYQSPFELSGGQKRRVAIAGVLAMKPEVLILDEPTAGLDPKGRDEILQQIKKLQTETDPKKRDTSVNNFMYHIHQAEFFQIGHSITKGADPGKNDFFRRQNRISVPGQYCLFSQKLQRLLHTLSISCIVV